MKVLVEIDEDQKEFLLDFLRNNNFHFELGEEFEIPEWQKEMVLKRRDQLNDNPEIISTWESTIHRLKKQV
ncbi:MAG: hypothetical protein GC181_10880 [Bacteroidetes bacterium]|nr:hypothetical protein [Bacteroidota bacterium]